jgi:hypothetical protein
MTILFEKSGLNIDMQIVVTLISLGIPDNPIQLMPLDATDHVIWTEEDAALLVPYLGRYYPRG